MGAYDCDCINNLEYDRRERKAQLSQEGTTSDLISRRAAINAVNNAFDRETLLTGFVRSIAVRAIRDMPSVQPERAKGEWINTNPEYKNGFYNNSYYCSECHDYYTTSPYEMNYCPNCGARMKGASE